MGWGATTESLWVEPGSCVADNERSAFGPIEPSSWSVASASSCPKRKFDHELVKQSKRVKWAHGSIQGSILRQVLRRKPLIPAGEINGTRPLSIRPAFRRELLGCRIARQSARH